MTERNPNQPTGDAPPPTPRPSDVPAADAPTQTWTPPAWTPPQTAAATVEETAPPATPAEPVRTTRGNGLRWGIALLVTVVVLGIGAVAALLLTSQSAP